MTQREELGSGLSGTVYLQKEDDETFTAVKVFDGKRAHVNLANLVLSGSYNPYECNEDAVISAHLKRKILSQLVPFWTEDDVRVAESKGYKWNDENNAYELHTEFIKGRGAKLATPFERKGKELSDLMRDVMKPLQRNLIESGFEGLAWQAGYGNPKGVGNFLVDEDKKWVWIDLESGVPQIIPVSGKFFTYYLPKAIKKKRIMFDDIDTDKLRDYVQKNTAELKESINLEQLVKDIDEFELHQNRWKSLTSTELLMEHCVKKGKIKEEDALVYRGSPKVTYFKTVGRELKNTSKEMGIHLLHISKNIVKGIYHLPKFTFSKEYREKITDEYIENRINTWEKRRQITKEEATKIREEIKNIGPDSYLKDFCAHIAIEGAGFVITGAVTSWYLSGGISTPAYVALSLADGPFCRTLYTSGKIAYNIVRNKSGKDKVPLTALIVGMIPFAGVSAYILQDIISNAKHRPYSTKFFAYDMVTVAGENLPVIGGKDTLPEHSSNKIVDSILNINIKDTGNRIMHVLHSSRYSHGN